MNLDRRLWAEAQADRPYLILAIGAGFAAGTLAVAQAYFLSQAVGLVFLHGRTLSSVWNWLLALLGVVLLRAGLAWMRETIALRAGSKIKERLRQRLFSHLVALGPAYARRERTGELAGTLIDGVELVEPYFSQYLPNLALAIAVPLAILACVFPLDWVSGLVFLLTGPLIPIFMVLIGKAAELETRRQWEALSRLSAHFLDVLQGLTTLKLLGRSRAQVEAVAETSERYRRTTMKVLRVAFLSAFVLELMATMGVAVVAVEVGLRLIYGALAFESAFFVLILAPEFYLPLRALGASFHAGVGGLGAAQRIYSILAAEVSPMQASVGASSPAARALALTAANAGAPALLPAAVRFEDVYCAYGGERPALRGVSFALEVGQVVALVGPSGAGKSTVVFLLLRFQEPDRGLITVGGTPLSAIAPSEWRRQVAWVPQNPYLFRGTVAENIRLARPEASHDEVVRAARLANADGFIQALPNGYETPVGERGIRLSGGQAQRLALARAFLKDAPLLVLDEPTASLDPEAAAAIDDAIERLLRGRSVLLIAHRLSSAAAADRVVVLSSGRVVEMGTHESLRRRGGLYFQMVSAHGGTA